MTKNEMKLLRITKVSSDWLWPDTHQTSFIVPYTRCICIHRKTVLSIRISGKKGETCIAIADRLNTMAQDILFSNSFDLWQSDSRSYLVWHCHWFYFFLLLSTLEVFLTPRHTHTHTHTHTFNGLLSGTTRVSRYQKGKIYLDFIEARDSEWQWHQLGHMQVCSRSRQITPPAPHHSVFYRPDALPTAQSTASKHGTIIIFVNTTDSSLTTDADLWITPLSASTGSNFCRSFPVSIRHIGNPSVFHTSFRSITKSPFCKCTNTKLD